MPTYDYMCRDCGQRFEIFLSYREYGVTEVRCAHCSSANVKRRLNRVRLMKSETSRAESMEDGLGDLEGLENDPKALGRMMKKMGREMGKDLPPEFDEVTDRLEAGQSPEEIESALPDLGAGGAEDA